MYSLEDTSTWFWELIAKAGSNWERLVTLLEPVPDAALFRFQYEFESTMYLAYSEVRATLEVSEDGAQEVCSCLVSQGRDYFAGILRHPQNMPGWDTIDLFTDLGGVVDHVWIRRSLDFLPVPSGGYWAYWNDYLSLPWFETDDPNVGFELYPKYLTAVLIHKEYLERHDETAEVVEIISNWFWDLIDQTGRDTDKLAEILTGLTKEQIRRFAYQFAGAALILKDDLCTRKMTPDGYISEDNIDDVATWIVSQGRAYYREVLVGARKTALPDDIDQRQNLFGVAYLVHGQRFGEDLSVDIEVG